MILTNGNQPLGGADAPVQEFCPKLHQKWKLTKQNMSDLLSLNFSSSSKGLPLYLYLYIFIFLAVLNYQNLSG